MTQRIKAKKNITWNVSLISTVSVSVHLFVVVIVIIGFIKNKKNKKKQKNVCPN